ARVRPPGRRAGRAAHRRRDPLYLGLTAAEFSPSGPLVRRAPRPVHVRTTDPERPDRDPARRALRGPPRRPRAGRARLHRRRRLLTAPDRRAGLPRVFRGHGAVVRAALVGGVARRRSRTAPSVAQTHERRALRTTVRARPRPRAVPRALLV